MHRDVIFASEACLSVLVARIIMYASPASGCVSASLLLKRLELSDAKSMGLDYEPSSEPLHISGWMCAMFARQREESE